MKNNPTKQKVVEAASSLFFQKGFHGTSVRDIADKAAVNVSLISYYFNSKQGLLEYAVTHYYEIYLQLLEKELLQNKSLSSIKKIKHIIEVVIQYKMDHFQLTSFIYRELSLDTIFVREMTVTYLAKENHLLSELFYSILNSTSKKKRSYYYMQLKGMIMSPFILKPEWSNQIMDRTSNIYFTKQYAGTINEWIDFLVIKK